MPPSLPPLCQVSKSGRTPRLFVHFFGFFAGRVGPIELAQTLEGIQGGLTRVLLQNVVLPNAKMSANAGGSEAKTVLVGFSRLLCEYADLQSDLELWGGLLSAALTVAAPEKTALDAAKDEDADEWEMAQKQTEISGEAVYSKLHLASKNEQDWFPEIPDATAFLVQRLHGLLSANPGRFNMAMQKCLAPTQLQALSTFFEQAGVRLQ